MNAFALAPSFRLGTRTGYENIDHGIITALSQSRHAETSIFHLPVREMSVTLDDVVCLIDIPIVGRLIVEEDIEYADDIVLLQTKLGFTEAEAQTEVREQWGGYVSINHLRESYERLLNMCNQLEKPGDDEEEEEEHGLVRTMCIKAFLLLLVGLTMFANNNINVNMIWLTALHNLDTVDE